MRKLIVNGSMVIANCFLLLTIISYQLPIVYAADSTPSANVKTKLEQLKSEIASKAAKLKEQINQKLTNKAYIGIIKSKSDTTLTLATRTGTKIININQDTLLEPSTIKGKKTVLKEEDSIAALGDVDETGVLTARKVVKLPVTNNQLPVKTYHWGQVISASDDIITIRDKSGKNLAVSITKVGTEIEVGQTIIVTGLKGKNEVLTASFIFVTNKPKVLPSPLKESTKSATPSAKKKL